MPTHGAYRSLLVLQVTCGSVQDPEMLPKLPVAT